MMTKPDTLRGIRAPYKTSPFFCKVGTKFPNLSDALNVLIVHNERLASYAGRIILAKQSAGVVEITHKDA